MRITFLLFVCLLVAGTYVNLVSSESTPVKAESRPSEQQMNPAADAPLSNRPGGEMDDDEKNRWRKLRFWDVYEPTKQVKFNAPMLYVERYAARNVIDPKISVFDVQAEPIGEKGVRLTGTVLYPEYAEGLQSTFQSLEFDPIEADLKVLPGEELGVLRYGLATTHTVELRREPEDNAEQVNQAAFGDALRLLEWSADGDWVRVVASDGYIGWARLENIRRMDLDTWTRYFGAENWLRTTRPIRLERNGEAVAHIPAGALLPLAEDAALHQESTLTGVVEEIQKGRRGRGRTRMPRGGASGDPDAPGEAGTSAYVTVALPLRSPDDRARIPAEVSREFRVPGDERKNEIIALAEPLLEVPYVWGGISEQGVDCSGFTQYVYRLMGLALPRDADEQSVCGRLVWRRGEPIEAIRPGDLLFFINSSGRVSHVALSLGGTEYVHAAAGRVHYASLDPQAPNFIESYLKKMAFVKRFDLGSER